MPDAMSERLLILAPMGRDAAVASALLGEAGMPAETSADLTGLLAALDQGAGAVILTEEAVGLCDSEALSAWLERQPAWSDLPIIVLTHRGGGLERNPGAARLARKLGNVTFLERPFHPTTLISVAATALRSRRRQYETRAHMELVREGEARLRLALKAGRLGSWMLDLATSELTCTERHKAIFGRAAEQPFSYRELKQCVHADHRQAMQAAVDRTIATGCDYESEYRILWPDDSVHWVESRARLVRSETGAPARLIGVSSDVTERKRVEETLAARVSERTAELEASQRRFRAVFDSAFQMAMLADLDGRIILANRTSLDAIGRRLADVAALPIWEAPWWSETPREAQRLQLEFPYAAAGGFVRYDAELMFPDGIARTLDFSLKPVLDEAGAVVQVVAEGRDVTELKQTEATLRQSQKLETIGQLTGGIAHDFNNLLMAVIANLELLQRQVDADPRQVRLVEGAMQGAQRGAALTQRLLAFARRQDLQPQAVNVPDLIEGMLQLLGQSIGPGIQIAFEKTSISGTVLVDPNQLELAILNLALNARDAMPDGGAITISVAEVAISRNGHHGLEPGTYVSLNIRDTGCGMDEATLKRAVEPFFSTKGVGKGTGLGLSMSHGLAVQSGGTLRLSSEVGQGTTAEILLPVTRAAKAATQPPAGADQRTAPATIMVVDDDALIAMSTAMMLEDLGHRVIEANCGASALEILESHEDVDVLLTDHAMPGMSGLELAQRARALRPGLPILLMTGYADPLEQTAIELPRLNKPYGQSQLAAELAKLLPCST
jgi:PAS domain S-box-containing protein